MTDFERLFGALASARVEYVLVGGMAAVVHGSARLTQDLDVVYLRTEKNLNRVCDALALFKLPGVAIPKGRFGPTGKMRQVFATSG